MAVHQAAHVVRAEHCTHDMLIFCGSHAFTRQTCMHDTLTSNLGASSDLLLA